MGLSNRTPCSRRHLRSVDAGCEPLQPVAGEARPGLWCDRIYLADVVRMVGDLHLGSAPIAERALLSALKGRTRGPLIVDVSELGFCDSAGLHTFVRVNAAARVRGRDLILRRPPLFLRRIIEIADLTSLLSIEN